MENIDFNELKSELKNLSELCEKTTSVLTTLEGSGDILESFFLQRDRLRSSVDSVLGGMQKICDNL